MKEDFLYFIWQSYKLHPKPITTTNGEEITIYATGVRNKRDGPDFFNALLEIDGQQWAGNVEMHLRSSDWYVHSHENDPNYDNVVLHVVWEHDIPIFRRDGTTISTLELRHFISHKLVSEYQSLVAYQQGKHFINCENVVQEVAPFIRDNWLERVYFERLQEKSQYILDLLARVKNDWEQALFCLLMKNFGLNVNGDSFYEVALSLDVAIIRKLHKDVFKLEALLMGCVGLLQDTLDHDPYYQALQLEYGYLSKKYVLDVPLCTIAPKFHGLRPNSFPTIRLAQLARLLAEQQGFFQQLMAINDIPLFRKLLTISASNYWDNHYVFGKVSKKYKKRLSSRFIDLIIINTIIPLKFCHAKKMGKDGNDEIVKILRQLSPEHNSLFGNFKELGWLTIDALESQAKIQLYKEYCSKNRCLQCEIGTHLLRGNL